MIILLEGKVKEIKENGVWVITDYNKEIFLINSYKNCVFDFNKLDLRNGDRISTLGYPLSKSVFQPSFYVENETRNKSVYSANPEIDLTT